MIFNYPLPSDKKLRKLQTFIILLRFKFLAKLAKKRIKHRVAKRRPFVGITHESANQALAALEGTEPLLMVCGDQKIMPGIELLFAPGHTIGLQAVAVNTDKGTAIVAPDCAHIARSLKEDNPSRLITDMIAWLENYDDLRAKTSSIDLIFPGHDVMMVQNYPKVAEDVIRLV